VQNPVHIVQDFYYIDIINQKQKKVKMKKENIEKNYDLTLDLKFIEKVGSPFDCDFLIIGTDRKVAPVKDKKILVIRLEGLAELYALNNSVTYLTDNKEKYDKFLNTVNHEKFGSDDSAILFNDWKNIDKLLKENNMKFDVCIMNPPYDYDLHLQVLSNILQYINYCVSVNPVRWLQDPFARHKKNSNYHKFESTVSKRISSLELVDNSNELFDIDFACNLAIYVFNECGGFDYESFNKNDLIEKFISKCKTSIADISTEEGYRGTYKSKYFGIVNSHYGDFSRWISDKFELFVKRRETNTNKVIFFDNAEQVKNCFDYLDSKVMRGYAKLSRTNQRAPWQFVTALDFNRHWTDADLCEYFGITGYISNTKAETGSEWALILNSLT